LKHRRVRFTFTAQQHVAREKAWWLEHRDHTEVFAEELEQALKVVATLPGAGTVYARSPVPGVRRVFLRRVALHLYYTFDDDEVVIRALWGARREHGPQLDR
jgi:plasmid stabilization system protein ParE